MNNRLRAGFYLSAIMMALNPTYASAQTWLCMAEQSTGFVYDSQIKKWKKATFTTENERYIIKLSQGNDWLYEVRQFGQDSGIPYAWCNKDFNEPGFLHCSGLGTSFVFNKSNNRFQTTYQGSYIAFNPNSETASLRNDGGDTPAITIGTCSSI